MFGREKIVSVIQSHVCSDAHSSAKSNGREIGLHHMHILLIVVFRIHELGVACSMQVLFSLLQL